MHFNDKCNLAASSFFGTSFYNASRSFYLFILMYKLTITGRLKGPVCKLILYKQYILNKGQTLCIISINILKVQIKWILSGKRKSSLVIKGGFYQLQSAPYFGLTRAHTGASLGHHVLWPVKEVYVAIGRYYGHQGFMPKTHDNNVLGQKLQECSTNTTFSALILNCTVSCLQ